MVGKIHVETVARIGPGNAESMTIDPFGKLTNFIDISIAVDQSL